MIRPLFFLVVALLAVDCDWPYGLAYLRDNIVAVDVSLDASAAGAADRAASSSSHITLVRCFIRGSEVHPASAAVQNVLATSNLADLTLQSTGYRTGTWNGVSGTAMLIEPSPDLRRFEERMVDALRVFAIHTELQEEFIVTPEGASMNKRAINEVERFVPDSSGVNYRPMVMVGQARSTEAMSLKPVGVSLYQLDRTGTAQRLLWSAADATR
jgi:hypothetical protein